MLSSSVRLAVGGDYLFSFVESARATAERMGVSVIPLGVGDSDLSPPPEVATALVDALRSPCAHRYPPYEGIAELRTAAATYMKTRFGADLDPESEVLVTLGSKEAMAHLGLAYVDAGDVVLVPDPAYPVYETWARYCGADVHRMPLRAGSDFLPDLTAIPAPVARAAKLLWVCYPNNPTAALATHEFYCQLAEFGLENDIVIASDAAYSEVYYGCPPPLSFLSVPGALECGIEFHSLSKTFSIPGWRVGFAVGNAAIIESLRKIKTHTDSGTFVPIQQASATILNSSTDYVDSMRRIYADRMAVLCDGLGEAGLEVIRPNATFYSLIENPSGSTSTEFANELLRAGVLSIPGNGFGTMGEGYVRLTVCAAMPLINEAVRRIQAIDWYRWNPESRR